MARELGAAADPIAGALLGLAGSYAIVSELISERRGTRDSDLTTRHLVVLASALSIDNLVVGFALGAYHVNLAVAAVTIAAVSVGLSVLGMEIGGRLGEHLGRRSELVGGAALILVGVAVGTGLL